MKKFKTYNDYITRFINEKTIFHEYKGNYYLFNICDNNNIKCGPLYKIGDKLLENL